MVGRAGSSQDRRSSYGSLAMLAATRRASSRVANAPGASHRGCQPAAPTGCEDSTLGGPSGIKAPRRRLGTILSPNDCRTVTAGTQNAGAGGTVSAQCRAMRRSFKDPEAKRTMLVTADQWLMLAAQRVKQIANRSPPEDAAP